jgi:Flp pilus assembly protein TadD
MRRQGTIAFALFGAALMISGCTTDPVDALSTTSITPPAADISTNDLTEGKAQFRDGNYGLAEKHFRQAVELRADNAEAWMGLAASYDELGRFDFADRAYDQLVRIAGRRPRIVNNMGYSQLLRGNKKKARQLLLEAERAMPGDKLVEANIALLNKG